MDNITIPPEALEAAARAIEDADVGMVPSYEEAARAACLAMLKAWPGFWIHPYTKAIILPLPTENTDAEA